MNDQKKARFVGKRFSQTRPRRREVEAISALGRAIIRLRRWRGMGLARIAAQ